MIRHPRRRPDPVIVEIEPLFVIELARDLRGREVVVPRIPADGGHVPPVALIVRPSGEVAS